MSSVGKSCNLVGAWPYYATSLAHSVELFSREFLSREFLLFAPYRRRFVNRSSITAKINTTPLITC